MRMLGEALARGIRKRAKSSHKPKYIDEIVFDKGALSIIGWSQPGPPQSVNFHDRPVYQRGTTGGARPDVAVHFGLTAAEWGFTTTFDLHAMEFNPERLSVVFPDGDILNGATARRIIIRTETERVVEVPSHRSLTRAAPPLSSGLLADVSNGVWGEQRVHTGPPRVESHYDARLIPVVGFPDHDPHWGVYSADGALIDAAAHKRGPGRVLLGQSETIRPRGDFTQVDAVVVYGGLTVPHFGHFLLSSLSRHWQTWKKTFPGTKIYMHTMESLEGWLSRPFVREMLGALGYEANDFVAIAQPIQVRHLIVPASSFVEQCEAHSAFEEMGRLIGERLWRGPPPTLRSEPVYLSKEQVGCGVSTIRNESVLTGHLRKSGVRIVHPETMSLPDQIRVFAEHRTVIGLIGSAHHVCLFSQGEHRLIGINPTEYLNSNFVLIDKLKGNDSLYIRPRSGMAQVEPVSGFQHAFELPDPEGISREIMRQV